MSGSSQKFIARNRAPRVQIEYDVELYGSNKKMQIPFVMGVMADLSGKPAEPLAPVADRKFLEIEVDHFDHRLKWMKARCAFAVADGRGRAAGPLAPVADRKFLEIDFDNFDDRLKSMKPRVAFAVPNTLTGEGNLSVDITFESMADFSPEVVAKKVGALNNLLEARTQLKDLLTYMDGKVGAEELLGNVLKNPELLKSLAAAPKPTDAPAQ